MYYEQLMHLITLEHHCGDNEYYTDDCRLRTFFSHYQFMLFKQVRNIKTLL